MSRRWRYPRARRGDFYTVVPTAALAAPPPPAPPYVRRGARWLPLPRRASYAEPVWIPPATPPAAVPVPSFTQTRRRIGVIRRGEFFTVPWPIVAPAGPGPLVPPYRRPSTRRLAAPRRGEFWLLPLVGQAPAAPQPVPTWPSRARIRPSFVRRGIYAEPPWTLPQAPAMVQPSPFLAPRRPRGCIARRGRFGWVPLIVIPPAGPGPLVPARLVPRRPASIHMAHRGSWYSPAWPAIVLAAYTPILNPAGSVRPNTAAAAGQANLAMAAAHHDDPAAAGHPNLAAAAARPNPAEAIP